MHRSNHAVTTPQSEGVQVGPFVARFDRENDNPFLNYAVPEEGAAPSSADVATLAEEFGRRKRRPRLEYVDAAEPVVLPALLDAGFVTERRLPIMLWHPTGGQELEAAAAFELLVAEEGPVLDGAARVQHEVYEETRPFTEEDVRRMRGLIAAGGVAVLARHRANGTPAGAGVSTPPRVGVTELAGIAVAASSRRRGIAGAITSRLVREVLRLGTSTIWLTPGGDEAERVYRRAGFTSGSEMLHISR